MRVLLPSLLLLSLLLGPHAALAETGEVRLGLEGGLGWFHAFPDEGTGPAGALRLQVDVTDRFTLGAGWLHLRHPAGGGTLQVDLVPLTATIRLDRAPIVPFFGGGLVLAPGGGELRFGPVIEAGARYAFSDVWAVGAQMSWAGLRDAPLFPWHGSLTAGLSATIL